MLSFDQIDQILKDIHRGVITSDKLPELLYLDTGGQLQKALYQGFGFTLSELDKNSTAYSLLDSFRNNTYRFSGAKTFQTIRTLESIRFDENGFLKTFKDYKRDAIPVYDKYNRQWLKTEINATTGQSDMAAKWNEFEEEKDLFPLLRYQTVNDANVREEHAALDNITLPVDDPFWNDYLPLNGFGCRCSVIQLEKAKQTEFKPGELDEKTNNITPLFKTNPAKNKYIFNPNIHPYFDVPQKYEASKQLNFGFQIPE